MLSVGASNTFDEPLLAEDVLRGPIRGLRHRHSIASTSSILQATRDELLRDPLASVTQGHSQQKKMQGLTAMRRLARPKLSVQLA